MMMMNSILDVWPWFLLSRLGMAGIGTVWMYQGVSVYSMYPNDEQGVGMESNTMNTISESVSFSPSSSIGRFDYKLLGPEHGLAMHIG